MTRGEFLYADNKPKYDAIVQAIKKGEPITLTTQYRSARLTKPEHIRILDRGTVQIPEGKKWVSLTNGQVDVLAKQAGFPVPDFNDKVYHHIILKEALAEGKPIPEEVLAEYPELSDDKLLRSAENVLRKNTFYDFELVAYMGMDPKHEPMGKPSRIWKEAAENVGFSRENLKKYDDGTYALDASKAGNTRDTFTVNRVPSPETFKRGDYVRVSNTGIEGYIAGIRHSDETFRLKESEAWYVFPYAYHAEPPVIKEKRPVKTKPLSSVLEDVNAENETDFTEDDRVKFKKETVDKARTDTPEFKHWFGDWEKAQKYNAIAAIKPIIIKSDSIDRNKAASIYYGLDSAISKADNRKISFVNETFGKIIRHKEGSLILRIIPQIEEIVESSLPIYSETERDKQKHPNIDAYHNYLNKVSIDRNEYWIRFTVRDVKTNRNELHNAFLSNIEITKANQGDDHSGIILPGDRPPLTGLLDKVLASFMKDVKDAYDGSSKVVDENGEPLVVYSGHGNLSMWGDKWKPNLGTAGGFYATEDPKVASGYAQGKIGDREFYENGSQYRLAGKNGKLNKKIWQYELSDSQKTKLAELRAIDKEKAYDEGETFHLNEMDGYIQDNKNYDSQVRRWSYRGGSNNLQNIFEYYESMGYTIAYAKQGDGPLVERQQKNDFEDLLDTLGIEWNSYEWSQPGVIPVYLSIKNPLDASKPFPKDLLAALKEKAKYKRNKTDSH